MDGFPRIGRSQLDEVSLTGSGDLIDDLRRQLGRSPQSIIDLLGKRKFRTTGLERLQATHLFNDWLSEHEDENDHSGWPDELRNRADQRRSLCGSTSGHIRPRSASAEPHHSDPVVRGDRQRTLTCPIQCNEARVDPHQG